MENKGIAVSIKCYIHKHILNNTDRMIIFVVKSLKYTLFLNYDPIFNISLRLKVMGMTKVFWFLK